MRFESVRAHPFGPFEDETLTLAPGLNVVHGPNEAGKSTWHAALYAGLCGLRRGKGARDAATKRFGERHRPWDAPDAWAVSAVVALADGRRIELHQDLAGRVDCSAVDADRAGRDHAPEILHDGAPDGSRWLGLHRRSFRGAACVRQAQILGLRDDAKLLQHDLQRAAATGGADETAARALDALAACRREHVGSEAAPTRPLMVARKRLDGCRARLAEARERQEEHRAQRRRVQALEREAAACAQDVARLQAARTDAEAAAAERRADRAAALIARFPDGPPHRGGGDDRLAQRVAEALATWRACPAPHAPAGPDVAALERELAAADRNDEPPAASDRAPRTVVAPYFAAAGIAAGIALALADLSGPGLIAGALGLGALILWLADRRHARPAPPATAVAAERRRGLEQRIAHRREADRRHAADIARRKRAAADVRTAAARTGIADQAPEAQAAALAAWQDRRHRRLADLERQGTDWDALQRELAGDTLAQVSEEARRRRAEAAERAAGIDPAALAASGPVSGQRMAEAKARAAAARDAFRTADGELQALADRLPSVADAEDDLAAADRALEQVRNLGRTLDTTIAFLERAADRVHRSVAPVLRTTLLEWLPRVTGGRYTDCKVDPESLQVDVRSGEDPWRPAHLLSHGTAEQVYLLLRLALARHLVARPEICPLLLDDAVAAGDADRKDALLETLHAIAADTQVILFTHEEDVRAWAERRLATPHDLLTLLPHPPAPPERATAAPR